MPYYYSVSDDNVNCAYTAAIATVRRYRNRVAIMERIADALDGAYCTCKITAKATETLTDYVVKSVRYYGKGNKYLYIITADGDRVEIQLCKVTARRVDGAAIRQSAEYYRQSADAIAGALPDYYTAIQQYNVALAAVDAYAHKIAPVLRCYAHTRDF